MILGKIVAVFILLILIIYNAINVHFLPFVLLMVYCISILISFILMNIKARKIKFFFKKDRYIYDFLQRGQLEFVSRNVSSMPITNVHIEFKVSKDYFTYYNDINFVSQENCDTVITMSLPGNTPGVWNVWCLKAYYLDSFKIFRKKINFDEKCRVVIMPRGDYPVEGYLENLQKQFDDTATDTDKKGNSISEVVDVRDYVPGDKLNLIHWKISGKRNKLTVKEFASEESRQIRLYVNHHSDNSEKVRTGTMNVLYSVLRWLVKAGLKFSVVFQNENDDLVFYNVCNEAEMVEAMIRFMMEPFYYMSEAVSKQYQEDIKNPMFNCIYITEKGIGGDVCDIS
ncbi:MAG: DUF58 domain-containing protein [Lachnospiraceae bacterium]